VATKVPLAKPGPEVVVRNLPRLPALLSVASSLQYPHPLVGVQSPAPPPSLISLRSPLHLTVGPGRHDLAARQAPGVYTSGLHQGGPIEQRPNTP
jgi:hypothetical protein